MSETNSKTFHYEKKYEKNYKKEFIVEDAYPKLFMGTIGLAGGLFILHAWQKVYYGTIQEDIIFRKHILKPIPDRALTWQSVKDMAQSGKLDIQPIPIRMKTHDNQEKIFKFDSTVVCETPRNFKLCEPTRGEGFNTYCAKIPKGTQMRAICNGPDLVRLHYHFGNEFETRLQRAARKMGSNKFLWFMVGITTLAGVGHFSR